MKFTKEENYYLSKCFICSEFRSKALKTIGRKLAETELKVIDLIPDKLIKFIDVETLENKVIKNVFEEMFVLKNIENKLIKNFFIEKLSDYENFTLKEYNNPDFVGMGGLKLHYSNERVYNHDKRYFRNVLYYIAKTCVYHPNFEEAKQNLKKAGIKINGGGRGADYIENSFFLF